ncbi:zinc-dependent alcohol dehydrogenase [Flaviflexus equikiangi]|uniref:Alcohol dehydrogenase catalytic domain-containing protein n=1 Tax=Flaviflexus equikiangi TaxID=2758573 RepID=A0ABS2TII1_9ACTO|nr:zinc-binding dehydrogenase [Flaviflexus equikiangi]MBM9433592.1 alcohol dehydrogenase catalytic domain-containing protein [Flaviflexus equikiangi]
MKAIVKTGDGQVGLREVPDLPPPGPGTITVNVAATGICGTDRGEIAGTDGLIPRILGHEVAGVVAAIGGPVPGVPIAVSVGDRVVLETDAYLCRSCHWCRTEQFNRCPSRTGIGRTADGGLAEQITIRADAVHRLPETVSLLEGALLEPLAVAVHAVLEGPFAVGPGRTVVVTGPGTMGQLVAQVAGAVGARVLVIGLDRHEKRLHTARRNGAFAAVSAETTDVPALINGVTGGMGADVVFECSGAISQAAAGLDYLGKGGKLGLVAFYKEPLTIDAMTVVHNELEVVGCRGKRASSFRTALSLLDGGRLSLSSLIGSVRPLEEWDEAIDEVGQGIKVVMTPGGAPLDNPER